MVKTVIKYSKRRKKMEDLRKTMTKKQWIALQKSHRAVNGFNTGTRTMKSAKYPSRQELKRSVENETIN